MLGLYIVLLGPAFLFSIWAAIKVKSTFSRYSRVESSTGVTGAQAARIILDRNGLMDVGIEESNGWLSDHYDPSKRVLRLSHNVFHSPSLASIGVAAHEAGHALQDAHNYAPLKLRQALVPIASIGSNLSWVLLIGGMILGALSLVKLGIALFAIAVVVTIVTLPVEFNASTRAKVLISNYGLVSPQEAVLAGKVLDAAAMTYVAATLTAIAQLLYFLLRFGILGDD